MYAEGQLLVHQQYLPLDRGRWLWEDLAARPEKLVKASYQRHRLFSNRVFISHLRRLRKWPANVANTRT